MITYDERIWIDIFFFNFTPQFFNNIFPIIFGKFCFVTIFYNFRKKSKYVAVTAMRYLLPLPFDKWCCNISTITHRFSQPWKPIDKYVHSKTTRVPFLKISHCFHLDLHIRAYKPILLLWKIHARAIIFASVFGLSQAVYFVFSHFFLILKKPINCNINNLHKCLLSLFIFYLFIL